MEHSSITISPHASGASRKREDGIQCTVTHRQNRTGSAWMDRMLATHPLTDGRSTLGPLFAKRVEEKRICLMKPLPKRHVPRRQHGFFSWWHVHTKTCPECHG